MTSRGKVAKTLKGAIGPALAAFAVLAMAGYMIFGPTGLYAWGEYSQMLERREGQLDRLREQQAVLENRVSLLDPRHADPDMVDELVRRELGVSHPDDVIIPRK